MFTNLDVKQSLEQLPRWAYVLLSCACASLLSIVLYLFVLSVFGEFQRQLMHSSTYTIFWPLVAVHLLVLSRWRDRVAKLSMLVGLVWSVLWSSFLVASVSSNDYPMVIYLMPMPLLVFTLSGFFLHRLDKYAGG